MKKKRVKKHTSQAVHVIPVTSSTTDPVPADSSTCTSYPSSLTAFATEATVITAKLCTTVTVSVIVETDTDSTPGSARSAVSTDEAHDESVCRKCRFASKYARAEQGVLDHG